MLSPSLTKPLSDGRVRQFSIHDVHVLRDVVGLLRPKWLRLRLDFVLLLHARVVEVVLRVILIHLRTRAALRIVKFYKTSHHPHHHHHHPHHHHHHLFWISFHVKLGSDVCPRVDNRTSLATRYKSWLDHRVEKSPSASYPLSNQGLIGYWDSLLYFKSIEQTITFK